MQPIALTDAQRDTAIRAIMAARWSLLSALIDARNGIDDAAWRQVRAAYDTLQAALDATDPETIIRLDPEE